ncbi:MAG: hypothetical protein WBB39_04260 [Candidatus Saccharimonadales bacterium]
MKQTCLTGGFTVIEVTMFLAISSLMALIVFLGTSSSVARVRFQDSVRSTQSIVQKHYSDILNGVNIRADTTGCALSAEPLVVAGRSNCYLLGKVILFPRNATSIVARYVVGQEPSYIDPNASEDTIIASYNPTIVTDPSLQMTDTLPWGVSIGYSCQDPQLAISSAEKQYGTCPVSPTIIDSLLMLRSPRTGNIRTYTFYSNGLSNGSAINLVGPIGYFTLATPDSVMKPANICFQSPNTSDFSLLRVGGQASGGQMAIATAFDITASERVAVCGG